MKFNISAVLYKILAVFAKVVGTAYDEAKTDSATLKETAELYVANARERLKLLGQKYLSEDPNEKIDEAFLLDQLKEEKTILETELLSFAVIGSKQIEDIANGVIDTVREELNIVINQS